jgi:predicted transcriptional regulator
MRWPIKIVESYEEYNKELMRKLKDGSLEKKPERGIIMTPEVFSQVFTPERIRLLQRIYRNNLKNIYQLAKEMGKPYEVVFRNIKYLEGMKLVKIVTKENKKIPRVVSDFSISFFAESET